MKSLVSQPQTELHHGFVRECILIHIEYILQRFHLISGGFQIQVLVLESCDKLNQLIIKRIAVGEGLNDR